LAFSPDAGSLAVAGYAGTSVHDARTGKSARELGPAALFAVAWDGGGRIITGGELEAWQPKKDKPLWTAKQERQWVQRLAAAADGLAARLLQGGQARRGRRRRRRRGLAGRQRADAAPAAGGGGRRTRQSAMRRLLGRRSARGRRRDQRASRGS